MTAPTDWKSLAEEAAMDLEECPVEGCTNLPRHRGRHNKRGLLPETRAEVDKLTKKRGRQPGVVPQDPGQGSRPTVSADIPLPPEKRAELEQAIRLIPPEPVVITVELVVSVRVIP